MVPITADRAQDDRGPRVSVHKAAPATAAAVHQILMLRDDLYRAARRGQTLTPEQMRSLGAALEGHTRTILDEVRDRPPTGTPSPQG